MIAPPPTPENFVSIEGFSDGKTLLGDLDNDGDLDALIIGDTNQGAQPNVYKNDGTGAFLGFSTIATHFTGVDEAVLNDIDSDNDLDLIVSFAGVTNVYLNDSIGNFSLSSTSYFDNLSGASFAFFDFDRDGDDDFIISGRNASNQILTKLYRKNVNGSFTVVINTPFTAVWKSKIAVGDIDGDFDLDLILSGTTAANVNVLEIYQNNGSGNFSRLNQTNSLAGLRNGDLQLGDIDNDNDLDLFASGRGSSSNIERYLYLNNGLGQFSNLSSANYDAFNNGEFKLFDADGDQDLDLFLTGRDTSNSATTSLYINTNGFFVKLNSAPFRNLRNSSFDVGDVNNNGSLDLLIIGRDDLGNKHTDLYLNSGGAVFTKATPLNFPKFIDGSIYTEDINGDQSKDIIVFGNSRNTSGNLIYNSLVFINDGNGYFTQKDSINLPIFNEFDADFGDLDGDGDIDFVIGGSEGPTPGSLTYRTLIYLNDGFGNFTRTTQARIIAARANPHVQLLDIDNDMDLDLFIHSGSNMNYTSEVYLNDANGNFTQSTGALATLFTNLSADNPRLIDMDGDQDYDLLYRGGPSNTQVLFRENTGNGVFSSVSILNSSSSNRFYPEFPIIDINNDGFLDLVFSSRNIALGNLWTISFMLNDGFNQFQSQQNTSILYPAIDLMEFEDLDLDGDLDILVADINQNSTHPISYYNDGLLNFSRQAINDVITNFRGDIKLFNANQDSFPDYISLGIITPNQGNMSGYLNLSCSRADISKVKDTLIANYLNATYQWLDCNNNYAPIIGATSQSLIAPTTGSYSVAITSFGCTDTSDCKLINLVGIEEDDKNTSIQVFPNPSSGQFFVQLDRTYENVNFQILNPTGKIVESRELNGEQLINVESELESGIYFLSILLEKERIIKKIVIQ